jgi:predicted dehydrogenase
LKAWEQVSQASIVAIADLDHEAALQRGSEFHILPENIYASFEQLLQEYPDLDFVDIATPPNSHTALVKIAAENGLNVLCQKPFAYSLKDAHEMIAICEQTGVLLSINENWRWRTWYRDLKTLLASGEIGKPSYAKFFIHSDYWLRADRNVLPYRNHGVFMEWGIHHIDLMRFLFGEVESVYGRMQNIFQNLSPFEQKALVMLNFESGMMAYLDMSSASYAPYAYVNRNGPMVEDVRIEGDRGAFLLQPDSGDGDLKRLVTQTRDEIRPAYDGAPFDVYQASYTAAHQHFVDCLLSGKLPETHAGDNLETLAVTLAAYHAAETNRVTRIEDFKKRMLNA